MLPGPALLFFDETITVTSPPPTLGQEPAHLAKLVLKRQPVWSGEFFNLFQAAKREHAGFVEAMNLLTPLRGQLSVILPTFGYDHEGLRWAIELCGTADKTPEDAFEFIELEAAAAGFFRHLSEIYAQQGADGNALYEYCAGIFTQGQIRSLLAECYFARLNVVRLLPFSHLLVTNPKIIEILGRQLIDVPAGALVDEQRRKAIAWEVFSRLISPKTTPLDSRTVEQIAGLRQSKKREIEQLGSDACFCLTK